jgi:hypothetical protein
VPERHEAALAPVLGDERHRQAAAAGASLHRTPRAGGRFGAGDDVGHGDEQHRVGPQLASAL